MKETATTVIIWLFLAFVTVSSLKLYFEANSRANRMETNLKAAQSEAESFKAKDGHPASRRIAQELTPPELRRTNPEIVAQLKNLYIAPRLAQSYTQLAQEMKAEISPTVKDTILKRTGGNRFTELFEKADSAFNDSIKIKVLEYQDKWISIIGKIDPLPAKIKILATDTIFTAIYKGERRRPWAWILSKRQLTTAATNRSPYIKINVIQSGVLKK